MRNQLLSLLPELNDIADPRLRAQVLDVWCEALTVGHWTPDDLRTIPFTLRAGPDPGALLDHVRACAQMCLAVEDVLRRVWAQRTPIHRDHLLAGALLADVGKLLEYERQDGRVVQSRTGTLLRHPFIGAALCRRFALPDEVTHIVATHSTEGDAAPRTPESIIFHHLDFIDFDLARAAMPRNPSS